jgi:hypothetical protein
VPGTRRDRAQADEAGIKKAQPQIETASVGIRLWAVFQKRSAHEPSPLVREWHGERLRRSQVVKILGSRWVQTRSPTPLNRFFRWLMPGYGTANDNVSATVQKQKHPACEKSLSLRGQRVTRVSGLVRAQNSGTIRATRPLYRGRPSDL